MTIYPEHATLYSYETGQPLRALTPDEWTTYQALMDSYTPCAKEHGVVEGQLFGHAGLVFARVEGEDEPRQVVLAISPLAHERLGALADANNLTWSQVVEHLVKAHPRWAPIDPNAPFVPADHLEVKP
jgi:hypothetical protein